MKKTIESVKPIQFVNTIPGFAEAHPIIQSTHLKRGWVEKNALDAQQKRQEALQSCPIHMLKDKLMEAKYIARCPGIREFLNTGYIVPLPCDIIIDTNGDGITFKATDMAPRESSFKVGVHQKEQLHDYSPLPNNTLKDVVKIITCWNIIPDDRAVFLVTTPFYGNNESRFTVASGILDPFVSTQINIFLYWHVLQGREVVKAGTPIAQLIPIPRDFVTFPAACKTASEEELIKIQAAFHTSKNSITNAVKDKRKEVVKKVFESKY